MIDQRYDCKYLENFFVVIERSIYQSAFAQGRSRVAKELDINS